MMDADPDIVAALTGEISHDLALARVALRAAVMRQITCPRSGKILDVRTAVLFTVTSRDGASTGSDVVDPAEWDGPYGRQIRATCERLSIPLEVIDGREVNR